MAWHMLRARDSLQKLEAEWQMKSSGFKQNGCIVANLIHCISKMRYKQGSGDPGGFMAYLKKEGLKPGVILRYVGNRLHVMFHMSATIFNLKEKLLIYFEQKCGRTNSLCLVIRQDLKNSHVQIQLQALGLFSKLLTGPWMVLIYQNERKLSNQDLVKDGVFKKCMQSLDASRRSPMMALTAKKDAFGHVLPHNDPRLAALQTLPVKEMDLLLKTIEALASSFIKKLECQLERYLSGDLSEPTNKMLKAASSAPVQNMYAERSLGLVDALWRRAPNASIGFVGGKVKAVQNNTMTWLNGQTKTQQEKLVKYAVRHGAKSRQLCQQRQATLQNALSRKQDEVSRKREKANRAKFEKLILGALESKGPVLDLDIFSNMEDEQKSKLQDLLNNFNTNECDKFSDYLLHHLWNVDGQDIMFFEKIKCVKKKTISRNGKQILQQIVSFTFWKEGETGESSANYNLNIENVLSDFALGGVKFISFLLESHCSGIIYLQTNAHIVISL